MELLPTITSLLLSAAALLIITSSDCCCEEMNVVEEIHFHMESEDDANIFFYSFLMDETHLRNYLCFSAMQKRVLQREIKKVFVKDFLHF